MAHIFNAEEARKLAKRIDIRELEEVLEYIKSEANKGNYHCYYYEKVSDAIVSRLKELGFTLYDHDDQRDGYWLKIEW